MSRFGEQLAFASGIGAQGSWESRKSVEISWNHYTDLLKITAVP